MVLPAWYAKCGTDIAHYASRRLRDVPGTDIAYGATRRAVLLAYGATRTASVWSYAMHGTELWYGATGRGRLWR
eukprot:3263362-Rhodomonas_salina.2